MTMISNDTGHRLFDPSCNSLVGDMGLFDAFSQGAGMLLRAMVDDFETPVSVTATGRSNPLVPSKTNAGAPDASPLRAYLEVAAARFEDPLISTVVCIKPSGRTAFAA